MEYEFEFEETAVAVLERKTPPAQAGRPASAKWKEIADNLRANPEEWFVVARDVSPTTAHLIRNGKLKAFAPAGYFESVSRGNKGNRAGEVYARFVGPTF
jgi:hypothetical protein